MSECPPQIPVTNDPQIIYLAKQIINLYNMIQSPTVAANTLGRQPKPTNNKPSNSPIDGDTKWIEVKSTTGKLTISHIGPSKAADSFQTPGIILVQSNEDGTKSIVLTKIGFQYDGKGHLTGASIAGGNVAIPLVSQTVMTGEFTEGTNTLTFKTKKLWVLAVDDDADVVITGAVCT